MQISKGHKGVKDTPAEFNLNILIHDHDRIFYNYRGLHQKCLIHILRYLLDSTQNKKYMTWNTKMRELLREMILHRNSLKDLDLVKVKACEERYGQILDKAAEEYGYEYKLPDKYYKKGYDLKERLRKFQEAHLLFLHDKNVPTNNSLAERLLRIFK